MKRVLITGANAGLGKEAARQIGRRQGVQTVFMGCRSPAKGEVARRELEASTGRSVFVVVPIDTSDQTSVAAAVEMLPSLDGVVMNAGGPGGPDAAEPTAEGVTRVFAANVLGHAALVEGLLMAGKLSGTVVTVSAEAVRGVPSMRMARPSLGGSPFDTFVAVADGSHFPTGYDPMSSFPYVKLVATLWSGAMARRHPGMRFVAVSPGATTGTNATAELGWLQRTLFERFAFPLLTILGRAHDLSTGAGRYLEVLDEERFASGHFYGAPWPSTSGTLVDQSPLWEPLGDPAVQDAAYAAVARFLPRHTGPHMEMSP